MSKTIRTAISAVRMVPIPRLLIYLGAAGTFILAFAGFGAVLFRMIRLRPLTSLPLGLVFVVPFWVIIVAWMLSPYRGALRLERRGLNTRTESAILVVAVVLIIALGANSFLATSAFVGGAAHPTADGVTMIIIPILQWAVLGAAALLLKLVTWRSGNAAA